MKKETQEDWELMDEEDSGQDKVKTNIVDLLMEYLMYWPWFVICLVLAMAVAWFALKRATPVFQVNASMLIKTNDSQGSGGRGMANALNAQDLGIISMANDFSTELKVISARTLIRHVVEELDLYVDQKEKTTFRSVDLYGHSPIKIWTTPGEAAKMGYARLNVKLQQNGSLDVKAAVGSKDYNYQKHFDRLPALLATNSGVISITRVDSIPLRSMEIESTITDPEAKAKAYKAALTVAPADEETYVASITFNDENPQRGEAFINKLVERYNAEANIDKNQAAEKTSAFINNRILLISQELGKTENSIAGFKKKAGLTDLTSDAQLALTTRSEYDKMRADNETQLRLIEYVKSFIHERSNENEIIPLNTSMKGQDDGGLSTLIASYNQQLLDRNRLLRNSSENNTVIKNIDITLAGLRRTILSTIASVERSAKITQGRLNAEAAKYAGAVGNVPEDEKEFLNISRQRDFQSQLYLILLQKREENAITLAATANNGRLIETPDLGAQVSPNPKMVYLVALILGLAIPAVFIYLRRLFSVKIESRGDVEKITDLPILGDIPIDKDSKGVRRIMVQENKNGLMEEIFRNFRTNLQFYLGADKKVILFTSTVAGEGKSTIACNLAASYAFLGKKVVVVGLDVRKPGLNKVFHFPTHRLEGITKFLNDPDNTDLLSLLQPSGVNDNLMVLTGGVVPPNPTELVARPSLDKAIDILKANFDLVILDTAPLGLMADTQLISRVADVTVYVCRENYTRKASFQIVNQAAKQHKLPNIGIVINGINMDSRSSGYYYGYGKYGYYNRYGYGYGKEYGYGYGKDHSRPKGFFSKFLKK